jgi:hypothetical protein
MRLFCYALGHADRFGRTRMFHEHPASRVSGAHAWIIGQYPPGHSECHCHSAAHSCRHACDVQVPCLVMGQPPQHAMQAKLRQAESLLRKNHFILSTEHFATSLTLLQASHPCDFGAASLPQDPSDAPGLPIHRRALYLRRVAVGSRRLSDPKFGPRAQRAFGQPLLVVPPALEPINRTPDARHRTPCIPAYVRSELRAMRARGIHSRLIALVAVPSTATCGRVFVISCDGTKRSSKWRSAYSQSRQMQPAPAGALGPP